MTTTAKWILAGIATLGIIYYKDLKQMAKKVVSGSYFTISELASSDTARKYGIDNTPPVDIANKLQALIDNILNPARTALGSAIYVNSGYRSPYLNNLVGGAADSQHLSGEAADITAGSKTKNKLLFAILANMGNYDQLIWEGNGTWIHVSYKSNGNNRNEMLAQTNTGYMNIKNNWKQIV